MLICTVLLNSFSVIASGEELVKQKQRGTGLVTQATTTTNSEDTSLLQKKYL